MFLQVCIPARLAIAASSSFYFAESEYSSHIATLFICIAIGFAVIYTFGLRKTGIEVGSGLIWWNHLRPLHALLYAIAAYLMYKKDKTSGAVLLLDAAVGLVAFSSHV